MDVKTTFLNGVFEEEVYMEQPPRFKTHDMNTHVCKLKKAFYGLKQELRTWYNGVDSFLMSLGFTKSKEYSNLYFKFEARRPVMLLLYVDDLFLKGEDEFIKDARRRLSTDLEMKYLWRMHFFLGMEVWQNAYGIFLSQGKYTVEILKRF